MDKDSSQAKSKPHVIECPVCGRKMTIPPGYENVPGKCRSCGAEINAHTEFDVDPLGINIDAEPAPRKRPPVQAAPPESWKKAALVGLLWGLLGALVVGAASGLASLMVGSQIRSVVASLAIANTGALVGFIICSTFVVVRRLAAGPFKGILIGAGISLVSGIVSYLLEWYVIAVSERTLLETAAVAIMGGSVVGIVFGTFLNRD